MMVEPRFNVLFLCTGNSARSVMVECAINRWDRGKFLGFSAGSHAKGVIHPMTLELLKQLNYEIASLRSKKKARLPEDR
jgi:protein-tyrosine-phosphatase